MGHRLPPAEIAQQRDLNNNPLAILVNNATYVSYLVPNASIQHLSMQNCGLHGHTIDQVMACFNVKHLRSLNISRNLLGFDSGPALVQLLEKLPQLEELDMRHVGAIDDLRVANAVLAHPSLRTFCTIPIQRLKDSPRTFQTLNLCCMEIGGHGGHVVAAVMRENASVMSLNLRSNSLTQSSMVALCHMLAGNRTLAHLKYA